MCKMWKTRTFLASMLCACASATAQEAVGMHLGTYHFDRQEKYNEINLGLYYRHNRWQTGAYHNSDSKLSVYGVYITPLTKQWSFSVGLATGYNKSVVPLATFTYSFGKPYLSVIPTSKGGIHLSSDIYNRKVNKDVK